MKHNLENFTLSTGTPTQNGLSPTHSHDPAYTILKNIFRRTGDHKSFLSPPNMAFHVLNAYEEDNTVGKFFIGVMIRVIFIKIVYDMTSSGNGNQFGTVWFANLTGNKEEMEAIYNHVSSRDH